MNAKGLLLSFVAIVLLLAALFPISVNAAPAVLYVKPGGLTSGACDSWANACELQYALTNAVSGQEIWVAAGIYKPTSDPTNPTISFQLKSGVSLYGGFTGMETTRDQRSWEINKTILSGDIDNNDINTDGNLIAETIADIQGDNTNNVVTSDYTDSGALLDGFIITAGQANGVNPSSSSGGGMRNTGGSPTLRNLVFSGNWADSFGGGMKNTSGSPTLTNVVFSANTASEGMGGGMYNNYGSETPNSIILKDVVFSANTANGGGGMGNDNVDSYVSMDLTNVTFINNSAVYAGGGMLNRTSSPKMENVIFYHNSATYLGGGMQNTDTSDPVLKNVTFSSNSAEKGGAVSNSYSYPTIVNSILWGDSASIGKEIYNEGGYTVKVTFSDIQNGPTSQGNINADPLFINPANGDLHLQAGSPAINSGSNTSCPSADLDGLSRPQGGRCDMGAYERKGGILPVTPTFADVPMTHPYWQDIEILYANGLTGGCATSPLKFCPDQIMDRAQAAVFMLRGNFGSSFVPPVPAHIFLDDWSKGTWAEQWAEGMYKKGLSAGCSTNPLKYCPWDLIPREQAVIFALRMKYGTSYKPPTAKGTVFADMTDPSYYATSWAEQAYKDGLIPNCGMSGGKPKFCPKDLVSRGLAAYMIVRAKNLTMP